MSDLPKLDWAHLTSHNIHVRGYNTIVGFRAPEKISMSNDNGLVDVEEKFKETQVWHGRLYQTYSIQREINMAPVDEVGSEAFSR